MRSQTMGDVLNPEERRADLQHSESAASTRRTPKMRRVSSQSSCEHYLILDIGDVSKTLSATRLRVRRTVRRARRGFRSRQGTKCEMN